MNVQSKRVFGMLAGLLLGCSSVSCGGAQTPSGSPPPPAPTAQAPGAPATVAWKDMKHDQRLEYMKKVVFPKMKEEFKTFDAKRYGEMSCATCHGDGAKDGSFTMPNPKLPKLPADEAGFKKLSEQKTAAVKFMGAKVVPEMAKMLGEEPFNPQTHQGFSCFECHTK
jgi:hypothetical protein